MQNGLLWASLVSVTGLVAMGTVAVVVKPPLVGMADLPMKMGATVSVEGRIVRLDSRAADWSRLRLQEANESVEAVIEDRLDLTTGDRVRITGQVGTNLGRVQLHVESASDVTLLVPWQEQHRPLAQLLLSPDQFAQTHVRTSGTVDRGMLRADHDAVGLPLRGERVPPGPHLVEGLFTFDVSRAQYYLEVRRAEALPTA